MNKKVHQCGINMYFILFVIPSAECSVRARLSRLMMFTKAISSRWSSQIDSVEGMVVNIGIQ